MLNSTRSQQVAERDELNKKLASTQSKVRVIQIEPLSSHKTELEQQLKETNSQLDKVKAVLSQPIKETGTTATLFTTAKAYSVEITKMTVSSLNKAALEEVAASAVSIAVTAEGDISQIIGFITQLNSLFATGAVQAATITNADTGSSKKPSVDINLTLYTVQSK